MSTSMDFSNSCFFGCARCGSETIIESITTEEVSLGEDGSFSVNVPLLSCSGCGFSYTDYRAEKIRHAGACKHMNLLTPDEIKTIRHNLEMTRIEFSKAFGIPPASLERWENGRLMQNVSMDTLLRGLQNPVTADRMDRRHLISSSNSKLLEGSFPTLANQKKVNEAASRSKRFHLKAVA